MALTPITQSTLPTNEKLNKLSDWESDNVAKCFIDSAKYTKVLLDLAREKKISERVKKILEILSFSPSPLTFEELAEKIGEEPIVVQGIHGLGGFAKEFLERLRKDDQDSDSEKKYPQPYNGDGTVNNQVLVDLTRDLESEKIHCVLRSHFRLALARCFKTQFDVDASL